MMGGGKSETYTGAGAGQLYKGDNDLMFKDLLRSISFIGFDPINNFKYLIMNSAWMWNMKYLRKRGFLVSTDGQSGTIYENTMLAYVQATLDSSATDILHFARTSDSYPIGTAHMELAYNTSSNDTQYFEVVSVEIDPISYYDILLKRSYPMRIYDVAPVNKRMAKIIAQASYDTGLGTQTYDYFIPHIVGSDLKLSDPGTNDANIIDEPLTPNSSVYYKVVWGEDDGSGNIIPSGVAYVDADDVTKVIENHEFFEFPLKKSKAWQVDDKYETSFMSKLGFSPESFDSIKNDDDAVDALLTYSASRDQSKYSPQIDAVYGTTSNPFEVIVNGSHYGIYYSPGETTDYGTTQPSITINGVSHVIESAEQFYMIALNLLLTEGEKGIQKRYQQLDDLFTYMGTASNTVELEWYQTTTVQLIGLLVSVVLSIVTENPAPFLLYVSYKVVAAAVAEFLGPEYVKYVGYIFAIIALVTGDWTTIWDVVSNVGIMINLASEVWFTYELEEIQSKTKELVGDTEKIDEEIDNMQRKTGYNPFLAYESYYGTIYNMPSLYYNTVNIRKSSYDNPMYEPFNN